MMLQNEFVDVALIVPGNALEGVVLATAFAVIQIQLHIDDSSAVSRDN